MNLPYPYYFIRRIKPYTGIVAETIKRTGESERSRKRPAETGPPARAASTHTRDHGPCDELDHRSHIDGMSNQTGHSARTVTLQFVYCDRLTLFVLE